LDLLEKGGGIISRVKQKRLVENRTEFAEQEETDFRLSNLRRITYRELKPGNLLDVGCAAGHMAIHALKRGRDVTAMDVSKKLLSILERKSKRINTGKLTLLHCGGEDIGKLGRNKFDNIVSLDVLEHIKDDVLVMDNLHKVLKRDGRLVLALPALKFLWGPRDVKYHHYRRYSLNELIAKLRESGFVIDKIWYWNFLGALVAIMKKAVGVSFDENAVRSSNHPIARALNTVLNVYFRLFENNLPMPFGLNLIVVAHKQSK